MYRRGTAWWFPLRRHNRLGQEAGAALFQGIRIRLTLWYCGVLGAALVLFSVALYIGVQYFLLTPIEDATIRNAHIRADQWVRFASNIPCTAFMPPGRPDLSPDKGPGMLFMQDLTACFDQHGTVLSTGNPASLSATFLDPGIVATALQQGKAYDTVNVGSSYGQVYRYALAVPNADGTGYIGVVVAGESVQAQENELSSLLMLLLSVGGLALLGAGIGGLFLANRAVAPARLAWTNQQRFIADASHELRTPLTLLRADAEVLLRGRANLDLEDVALLEDIVAEAQHMGTLATNLLTLARLDTGSIQREHELVGLAELAHKVVQRVQAFAEQSGVTVQVEANADNDPYVIGDLMQLEQAMLVVLDNAIKYNRRGGQVVVRTAVQGKRALLAVYDTGIGISAEHLPHLGERFYRVDKARSREAGGTGLGLSIARSIALTHDGQLTLASTPAQGTTVTLTLPLASSTLPAESK